MLAPTVFLHVPKCGGSSFDRILFRRVRPGDVFAFGSAHVVHAGGHQQAIAHFRALSPRHRRRARLLVGHMAYGVHELMETPCDYITFLRSPIERVVSVYNHVRVIEKHPVGRLMTLRRFVEIEANPFVVNGQTRMLAGDKTWRGWDDEIGRDIGQEDLLPGALRHLLTMRLVGLTERFDDTLLVMERLLGWPAMAYVSDNVTPADGPLSRVLPTELAAATRAVISEKNQLDAELYEAARAVFEAQLGAAGLDRPGALQAARAALARQRDALHGLTADQVEAALVVSRLAHECPRLSADQRSVAAAVYVVLFHLVWPGGPAPDLAEIAACARQRLGIDLPPAAVGEALELLQRMDWVAAEACEPT